MNRLIVAAIAISIAAPASALNLIQNGGFEQHQIANNTWAAVNATTNPTFLPSWTYFGSSNHNVALTGAGYLGQASQQVDVSGGSDTVPSGIFQSITTVVGQLYQLTFQVFTGGTSHTGGVNMNVYSGGINGASLLGASNLQGNAVNGPGGLKTYTYGFVATGTTTTVAFSMFSRPVSQIDNISVQAVPEPITMGLGLAAAGLFARRRLKGAARFAV